LTSGLKGILTEDEAKELYQSAMISDDKGIDLQSLIQELIQIRVVRALEALETALEGSQGRDAAAKLMNLADRNKTGDIDVIEFGRAIENVWKSIPRQELDLIFNAIDRNHRGKLTEQDMRTVFADKEATLTDTPFINANDIMLPFYTKTVRRMGKKPHQLWAKFNHDGKMGIDELQ
jgi:Ca2+-binding EF-hand superfamily protein